MLALSRKKNESIVINNDVEITVDDNSYQKNRIICALEHTGILNVENWLETEMKNKI